MPKRPRRSCWIWIRPTCRCTASQEGRFFHGYYDDYCYLPLYIFCGDHLLCVRLRQANIDAAAGSLAEIEAHRNADPRGAGRIRE